MELRVVQLVNLAWGHAERTSADRWVHWPQGRRQSRFLLSPVLLRCQSGSLERAFRRMLRVLRIISSTAVLVHLILVPLLLLSPDQKGNRAPEWLDGRLGSIPVRE